MIFRRPIQALLAHEQLNFLLTNRLPRQTLTRFMGWFSPIEQPWVRAASIALWRFFSNVDFTDAKKDHFTSLHDAFIRELKPGSRAIDTSWLSTMPVAPARPPVSGPESRAISSDSVRSSTSAASTIHRRFPSVTSKPPSRRMTVTCWSRPLTSTSYRTASAIPHGARAPSSG